MSTKNKIDKIFGPAGSSAGIFILAVGVVATFYSLSGLLLVLLGAFTGFSATKTTVDYDGKRMRFSNDLFGLIPVGRWIDIEQGMKIGIKKSGAGWRTYSRSNRIVDMADNSYRLVLFSSEGKALMPVGKYKDIDTARIHLQEIAHRLDIDVC